MDGVEKMNIRRGQLKAAITRFRSILQSPDVDPVEIKARREKIEEVWVEYEQLQSVIEAQEEVDINAQNEYRKIFEDLYFKSVAAAEKIITQTNGTEEREKGKSETLYEKKATPAVKLAALNVPTFSGNYHEWASYYDIFSVLVDRNPDISDIEKIFHLRASLSGEALASIQCLETTANNYAIAWKSLVQRYNNKRVLVQAHVKSIYDLEAMSGESASKLRQFTDTLSGHMRALEALGERPGDWGPLLIHLIATKIDKTTLREWESKSSHDKVPTVSEIIQFLESKFKVLEAIEVAKNISVRAQRPIENSAKKYYEKGSASKSFASTSRLKCFVCGSEHTIYKCPTFCGLDISDRIKRVTELDLCKICLRKHDGRKCNARFCFKCAKPHNTLLHLSGVGNKSTTNEQIQVQSTTAGLNIAGKSDEESKSVSAHASVILDDRILLATAIILLRDEIGNLVRGRVLLDSGSQSNLITEEMVQVLGLKKKRINHSLSGIGDSAQAVSSTVNTTIMSNYNAFTLSTSYLVVKRITTNIPSRVFKGNYVIPNNIQLADPSFLKPQKIDLLIGANHFFDLMQSGRLKPIAEGPVFQETCLGWVVSGPLGLPEKDEYEHSSSAICLLTGETPETDLERIIATFWRLEEYGEKKVYTLEEKACKNDFDKNVKRNGSGRFVVHLPFKKDKPKLGNSYEIAKRRLLSLERRFQRDPKLKTEYCNFMSEYEKLGHMEIIGEKDNGSTGESYYIPHHAVRNENSTTTKLRVVFDASCKTDTGISLNDILMKGPAIQDELLYILARFRTYNYVLSADIEKMYRQILVTENHRSYQRVLWRANSTQPIQNYQLNTLTYGTVPASYLATACLEKLAEAEYENYPDACLSTVRNFYMDDYLGGAMNKSEALKLRDNLTTIMKNAGLVLRKWMSNDSDLIADVQCTSGGVRAVGDTRSTKILGLNWNSDNDVLLYTVRQIDDKLITTKRKILAEIATIFDPLGLLGPVIVNAKLIMQNLWQVKAGWDEPLPESIQNEWLKCRDGLSQLNEISIPRKIICDGIKIEFQVHGFADASLKAYGACLYLRSTDLVGKNVVNLICAKSKVAPLKVISLPHLELCAALLLARLASRVIPKLNLPISQRRFWSDSTVTLAWISSPSTRWKTFVAHRVGEVQDLTLFSEWAHVSTLDNPADLISRGCEAKRIKENAIWWHGPAWLSKESTAWPIVESKAYTAADTNIPEAKENTTTTETCSLTCTAKCNYPLLSERSSLSKIIRITAYCLRWRKRKVIVGPLQAFELEYANLALIRMVQLEHFGKEIKALSGSTQVATTSKLFRLRPYYDKEKLLRVGGRLKNAIYLDMHQRNPIVLPSESPYTRLLFRREHVQLLHSGPQALVASIRQRYWPLKARNIARNTVHKCVTCFRLKPVIVQPIMGDLPRDRVTPSRPFSRCGIDFAGPIMIKTSLRRKAACSKGYIGIFVCFATKAVHIELISDLTTKTFLQALNRFFDRRGRSSVIYSDNATNFIGAQRQLKEIFQFFQSVDYQNEIVTALADKGVEWKCIPPRSPHFGGLWEAAVKSMKSLLYKVLGEARLTYEEMSTVLTRVEACLNSRPITPMSSDPTDLTVLTPGHFLIGDAITAVPERDETATPDNRLDRWRRVTKYSQTLWNRWSTEYLNQLQERVKWAGAKGPSVRIGTVVILRDTNLPPLQWRLGRVVKVEPGADGVIRAASVQTSSGVWKRAVRLLCPLPFEGNAT